MIVCSVYAKDVKSSIPASLLKRAAEFTLTKEKYRHGELSIHLVKEPEMQKLNRVHRGLNRPTDVLSFSALEGALIGPKGSDIGDVFLCIPYIKEQAKREGVSMKEECVRMLIHGVLHAIGYDHGKPEEAKRMFARQEAYLSEVV